MYKRQAAGGEAAGGSPACPRQRRGAASPRAAQRRSQARRPSRERALVARASGRRERRHRDRLTRKEPHRMATQTADPLLEQTAGDHDDDQDAPLEPDAAKGELFDRSQYDREDLAIPKVDGQQIDKIRVDFGGSIMLDRSDPADVALYNSLT